MIKQVVTFDDGSEDMYTYAPTGMREKIEAQTAEAEAMMNVPEPTDEVPAVPVAPETVSSTTPEESEATPEGTVKEPAEPIA